jgi:hypothetical protein
LKEDTEGMERWELAVCLMRTWSGSVEACQEELEQGECLKKLEALQQELRREEFLTTCSLEVQALDFYEQRYLKNGCGGLTGQLWRHGPRPRHL